MISKTIKELEITFPQIIGVITFSIGFNLIFTHIPEIYKMFF